MYFTDKYYLIAIKIGIFVITQSFLFFETKAVFWLYYHNRPYFEPNSY